MKKQEQNNPVAIGALLVILCGALVFIVRSLVGKSDPPPVTATPVPANAAAASGIQWEPGLQAGGRNPFFHPAIREMALEAEKRKDKSLNGGLPSGVIPGGKGSASPLLPGGKIAPVAVLDPKGGLANPKSRVSMTHPAKGDGTTPAAPDPALAEKEAALRFQVTAIFGGANRHAVLDDGKKRQTVSVGDRVRNLRVAAIHDREIVLAGEHGFWTIPLQTGATEETPSAAPTEMPAVPSPKSLNLPQVK